MPRAGFFDVSALILMTAAAVAAGIAYWKDPGLIAWEAPLMGWHFAAVRVVPSPVFPVVAGWLVSPYFHG